MMRSEVLRILHVVPFINIGGLWRHLQVALRMKTQIVNILSIFKLNDPRAVVRLSKPINALDCPTAMLPEVESISKMVEEVIRELKPDIVHSYHYYSDIYSIPAAHQVGIPIVRSVLGITQAPPEDPFGHTRVLYDWSPSAIENEVRLEPFVTHTVAVSRELRYKLLRYGLPAQKVSTVYFGVSVPRTFRLQSPSKAQSSPKVIGFVGRFELVKNPLAVLEVARRLRVMGIDVTFRMLGHGSQEKAIFQRIQDYGLDDKVVIFDPTSDVNTVINEVDLLIVPSLMEGLPIAILEAMACAKPVVASRVGGIPEVVIDGITGYLVEPDSIEGFVQNVRTLIQNPGLAATFGTAARRVVAHKFTLNKHLRRLARVYSRCIPFHT